MMKIIRRILYKIFGLKNYLLFISRCYITLINFRFLRKKYPEIFFLKDIIQPGFVCIDIGANLGYYSYFMAKYVKSTGRVLAIEPIPLFCDILKKNVQHFNNIEILNLCLGNEVKTITMGIPVVSGVIHHGMTHILDNDEKNIIKKYECIMVRGDDIFKNLKKVNFIKCDVEGYEYEVFNGMLQTIEKFKPIIQVEVSQNNKEKLLNLFSRYGYKPHKLNNNKLKILDENEYFNYKNDIYYIAEE